jgi:putative toxin-antitoxin system antitoxin component (TIGR02293 family)
MREISLAAYTRSSDSFIGAIRWGMICVKKNRFTSREEMQTAIFVEFNKKMASRFRSKIIDLILNAVWGFSAAVESERKMICITPTVDIKRLFKEIETDGASIEASQSERVARIARVRDVAIAVFGSNDAATNWLSMKHLTLNRSPLSMLDTEQGELEVMKILTGILNGTVV